MSTAAITPLAELPPGLAVADVDLGPYLVNLTRLDVLSAPYHRLGSSIVEAHRILHAPPDEAEPRLRAVGARYVVTCEGLDSTSPPDKVANDALIKELFADKPPAFLKPVTTLSPTPLKVWELAPRKPG